MKADKYMTVQEYADKEDICLAAAYKRVKQKAVEVERKFGRILIKIKWYLSRWRQPEAHYKLKVADRDE